jgi:hypothetical protein
MRNRQVMSVMTVWALIVGSAFAFTERPGPSSQPASDGVDSELERLQDTPMVGPAPSAPSTQAPAAQLPAAPSPPPAAAAPVHTVSAPIQRAPSGPFQSRFDGGMLGLERRARVDMILYKGRLGDAERAANPIRIDAVALTGLTAVR